MVGVLDGREPSPDRADLRAPFRQFWRWWSFWARFPWILLLPERVVTASGGWLVAAVWMPLFFWCGLPPMRLWLQRPKPVWLFFVLWAVVPLALASAVVVLLGLVRL